MQKMGCIVGLRVRDKREKCDQHLRNNQRGAVEGVAGGEEKGLAWRDC